MSTASGLDEEQERTRATEQGDDRNQAPDIFNRNEQQEEDRLGEEGDDEEEEEEGTSNHQPVIASRNPLEALVDWCKGLLPLPPQLHAGDEHDDSACVRSSSSSSSSSLAFVTLHYDVQQACTVAVLSKPDNGICSTYLQRRVAGGTARKHSRLYFELDGFVRPQFHHVTQAVQPHMVHVAVGALAASDEEHRLYLERRQNNKTRREMGHTSDELLAQALDICRLHRLQDDLDVLSLHFLSQANGTCRAVAHQIRKYQQEHLYRIHVTPYVDGANLNGYSRLTRQNETNLVTHTESGRSVLYRQCSTVDCRAAPRREKVSARLREGELGHDNTVVHSDQTPSYSKVSHEEHHYFPVDTTGQTFSWACEEIALSHLHQWWGDIAERDYIGQKLVLSWSSCQNENANHDESLTTCRMALDTIRLEAGPRLGCRRVWQTDKSIVTLNVLQSHTKAIDNVTLRYTGQARVMSVHVPWKTLVRTYATKVEWPRLTQTYVQLQRERPLLVSELTYGELVHKLVNGGMSGKKTSS